MAKLRRSFAGKLCDAAHHPQQQLVIHIFDRLPGIKISRRFACRLLQDEKKV
jgi:hypothetical protein